MFRVRSILLLLMILVYGCGGDDNDTVYECVLLQPNQEVRRLRDFQFARNRVFDLGRFGGVDYVEPGDSLFRLSLYQSAGSLDLHLPEAIAFSNSLDPGASSDSVSGRFHELVLGGDWEVQIEVDSGRFTVIFPSPLQNVQTTTIAYYMEIRKVDGSLQTFGSAIGSPLHLQMLKAPNPQPTDPFWEAECRNAYDLGKRYPDWRSLDIEIYYGRFGQETDHYSLSHQNGVSYLSLLGLDNAPVIGDIVGDGHIDNNPRVLRLNDGLLIFPSREPFADPDLLEPVTEIYDGDNLGDWVESSNYYITIRTSGFGRLVRLGHINIIEGSDRVGFGEEWFVRGVHYDIDYATGTLEFKDDDILATKSSIEICYEYESWP